MQKDYSPFVPGQPVTPEFFLGRSEQIKTFLKRLNNALLGGRAEVVFVSRERGIGKASLVQFVPFLAEQKSQVLGSHVPLSGVTDFTETVRRTLERCLQESLARMIFPLSIPLWSDEECSKLFKRSFQRINVEVPQGALSSMVKYAGGPPAFAHEIGDAVFQTDDDNKVDEQDAHKGIERAAEIVGHKYLDKQVMRLIRRERYRKILQFLVCNPNNFAFRPSEILRDPNSEERKGFDNFLWRHTGI